MALPFMKAETWLNTLTEEVDLRRITTPIKVEKEETLQVPCKPRGRKREISVRQYDITFNFRGTHGKDLKGSGRLFVPAKRPREKLPMVVSMHYEMDAKGSARFLAKGWATMTPHGERSYVASNLMGHGLNHSACMAQLPRRMPFVDQRRVVLYGGSAGGYHALMASSMVFPLTAVCALVPPLNLKYNINYLAKNDRVNVNPQDPQKPIAPVVRAVIIVGTETDKGGRPDEQDWKPFSPTFRTDLMTFPTLITYSTADVLVPIQQLSEDLVQKPPKGLWPKGYAFEMSKLVPNPSERKTLLKLLEPKDYWLKSVRIPRNSPTILRKREEMSPEEASRITRHWVPFSKTRRLSIFVLDEGYPEPFCGHAKYHHDLRDQGFFDYHMSRPAFKPEVLNREKLAQLMRRFSGKEEPIGKEYAGNESWPISHLDHPHIERWCVALGLDLYMQSARHDAARALQLYKTLPSTLQVLDLDSCCFEEDPLSVLLEHQCRALEEGGDGETARQLRKAAD